MSRRDPFKRMRKHLASCRECLRAHPKRLGAALCKEGAKLYRKYVREVDGDS